MSCIPEYVDIDTMEDYLQCIIKYDLLHPHWLLRGQNELTSNLLPSIGRITNDAFLNSGIIYERHGFEMFKRSLPLHGLYLHQLNEIDLLAIAQHYRLKTRLLDWSGSPFIALYFACDKEVPKDCSIVYACKFTTESYRGAFKYGNDEIIDPFSLNDIIVYATDFIDNRIYNQRGHFTIHPYITKDSSYAALNPSTPNLEEMIVFRIKDRVDIKFKLETIGFSPITMYNTLEATAEYANNWKLL